MVTVVEMTKLTLLIRVTILVPFGSALVHTNLSTRTNYSVTTCHRELIELVLSNSLVPKSPLGAMPNCLDKRKSTIY